MIIDVNVDWLTAKNLDALTVMKVLPHKYPFLLVDKIIDISTGKPLRAGMSDKEIEEAKIGSSVTGIKNVTFNEHQFQGHFPEYPIMPGVLSLEAMAQTAAFIVCPFVAAANNGKLNRFNTTLAGFDSVRFRRPIVPGDQMHMKVTVENFRRNIWSFTGEVSVEGKVAVEGKFLAQMT